MHPAAIRPTKWTFLALGLAFMGASLGGCRAVQTAADLPGAAVRTVTPGSNAKSAPKGDPVELQRSLMRFTDEYSTRLVLAVDDLERNAKPAGRIELQRWRIAFVTETTAIASGSNSVASLLDMIVAISLSRRAAEDYWIPKVYGESARPMLNVFAAAETELWDLAAPFLTAPQIEELKAGMDARYASGIDPRATLSLRALNFQTKNKDRPEERSSSVFTLLRIDPLAGLDPATREIAEARLFAERTLFVAQRMPVLLRWQIELLTYRTANLPEMQQTLSDVQLVALASERLSKTIEALPAQVREERIALVNALDTQSEKLTRLTAETKQALQAGQGMSDSLDQTLKTFDALMARFGVGEDAKASAPATNPATPQSSASTAASTAPAPAGEAPHGFDIRDYGETAARIEAMARQLESLLRQVEQNQAQLARELAPTLQDAEQKGRAVVDYAFVRALILLGITGALAAGLIWLHRRGR